jgi:hypothetical protein
MPTAFFAHFAACAANRRNVRFTVPRVVALRVQVWRVRATPSVRRGAVGVPLSRSLSAAERAVR